MDELKLQYTPGDDTDQSIEEFSYMKADESQRKHSENNSIQGSQRNNVKINKYQHEIKVNCLSLKQSNEHSSN